MNILSVWLTSGNAKKSAAYWAKDFASNNYSAIFAQSFIAYSTYCYSFLFRVKTTLHKIFTSSSDLFMSECLMILEVEAVVEAAGAVEEDTWIFVVKPEK
jgi:hypothetical protein